MKTGDIVRLYAEIRARVLAADPDIDDETLKDTLEGETDLHERVLWLARQAREAKAFAEALSAMAADMAARKTRYLDKADRFRSIALWAMQECGLPKIEAPDLTLSIGKGRVSVQIIDAHEVPPHLVSYEPKPDKDAIRSAIEAGEDVPGATLSNGPPTLTIRTK